jgi:hypothetical protein
LLPITPRHDPGYFTYLFCQQRCVRELVEIPDTRALDPSVNFLLRFLKGHGD